MLCTRLSFDKQFAELNAGIFLISPFPGKCCGSQRLSNQQRNPEQRTSQLLKMSVSSEGQKKYIKKIKMCICHSLVTLQELSVFLFQAKVTFTFSVLLRKKKSDCVSGEEVIFIIIQFKGRSALPFLQFLVVQVYSYENVIFQEET